MGNLIEIQDPEFPGSLGSRRVETLQDAFPDSPIYSSEGDAGIKNEFVRKVLDGTVRNGFGFSSFNRDFVNAPDIENIEKSDDDEELASPYAPNVSSPNDQATKQEVIVVPEKGSGSPFPGDGIISPVKTSNEISGLTLGRYGLGTRVPLPPQSE